MAIRMKVTYLFLLMAVVIVFLIQDRVIFGVQKLLCITNCPVTIGKSIFTPPKGWLLQSSRENDHSDVMFYGVIPQWTSKNTNYPKSRYFLFRALDGKKSSITVIQMDSQTKSKIDMTKGEYIDEKGTACRVKSEGFNGFKSFECSNQNFYVLLIPELEVIFIPSTPSFSALNEVKLKLVR